jgi:hypothetical protein
LISNIYRRSPVFFDTPIVNTLPRCSNRLATITNPTTMTSDLTEQLSDITLNDQQDVTKDDLQKFANSITTEMRSMAQSLDGTTVDPAYQALMRRFGAREDEVSAASWDEQAVEARVALAHRTALRILKAYQMGQPSGAEPKVKVTFREILREHDGDIKVRGGNPPRLTRDQLGRLIDACFVYAGKSTGLAYIGEYIYALVAEWIVSRQL